MNSYSRRHRRRLVSAFYHQTALSTAIVASTGKLGASLSSAVEPTTSQDAELLVAGLRVETAPIVQMAPQLESPLPPLSPELAEIERLKARVVQLELELSEARLHTTTAGDNTDLQLQMTQMQTQLVNIAAVSNASHAILTKLAYDAGHNAEMPKFPVASVDEVELMDGKIAADAGFKEVVIKKVKKAQQANSLRDLLSDVAMDGYTLSKNHTNIKGIKRKLAQESPLFKTIEDVVGASELKLLFSQVRSRKHSKASLAKKKALEERGVGEM